MFAMLLALALTAAVPAVQSEESAAADYFSGTVVSCTPQKVTVNRRTMARDLVTKTFLIDEDTKVEGVLKPRVHVTVRFVTRDAAAHAVHIIVR